MDAAEKARKAIEVEAYLRQQKTWVSGAMICAVFGVQERHLRAIENEAGICTDFAISGKRGFRHVLTCTQEEWEQFRIALNTHAAAEMSRVMTLARKREWAMENMEVLG